MIQTVHQTMLNHHVGVTILEQGHKWIPRMIWTVHVFLSTAEVRMCGAIIFIPLHAFVPK